jgi:polyisoprenoid-binding protein YceI
MKTLLASALALFAATAQAAPWDIDPEHATARFLVRHLTVADVTGTLGDVTGSVELNEQDLTQSTVQVSIDTREVDSRNKKRDAHLRSKDFLNVKQFPAITFKSTKVEKADGGLKVTGVLTIRDVARSVTLAATVSDAVQNPFDRTTTRGVKATTTLKREDFGLTWNATLEKGFLVGSDVQVVLDLELRRRDAAPAAAPKK